MRGLIAGSPGAHMKNTPTTTCKMPPSRSFLLALMLIGAVGCVDTEPTNLRPFTLDDAECLRQPERVSISADEEWIAYVVGDTLWVAPTHLRARASFT